MLLLLHYMLKSNSKPHIGHIQCNKQNIVYSALLSLHPQFSLLHLQHFTSPSSIFPLHSTSPPPALLHSKSLISLYALFRVRLLLVQMILLITL